MIPADRIKSVDVTQPNETEPRLTRGEYWILSAVVEAWMPLGRLTHSEIELAFNRPGHGLSDKAVATTVEGLCNAQLIRTKTRDGEVSLDPAQLRECVQEADSATGEVDLGEANQSEKLLIFDGPPH